MQFYRSELNNLLFHPLGDVLLQVDSMHSSSYSQNSRHSLRLCVRKLRPQLPFLGLTQRSQRLRSIPIVVARHSGLDCNICGACDSGARGMRDPTRRDRRSPYTARTFSLHDLFEFPTRSKRPWSAIGRGEVVEGWKSEGVSREAMARGRDASKE